MPNFLVEPRKVAGMLFAALVANAAGHAFILVALPGLARRLGFSDIQAGLLLGLSALAATLAAPLWGGVGDRSGRRRIILVGLGAGAAFLICAALLVGWRLDGGAAMMAAMAAMVAGQMILVRRLAWTPRRLCRVGAVGAALCLVVAAFAGSPPPLFAAIVGLGLFLGLLLPGNLARISLRADGAQASAAGVNAVAQGLGMALGPIAGAVLHRISPQAPYVAAAAVACVALLAWRDPEPFAD